MQVKQLWIYPIKSCQGISLTSAPVTLKGLKWDRELMLVDSLGGFLGQRQYPKLASVKVELKQENLILSLEDQNIKPLVFSPTLEGEQKPVGIWLDKTIAIDQGDIVANWFEKLLQLEGVRLVRQSPQHIRPIDPNYAHKENEPVSFADGYPLLLTNSSSLDELNRRLDEKYTNNTKISMNRFRPNVVVETDIPFLEDHWRSITIGSLEFAVIKSCSRCIVTTTDQASGQLDPQKEPLATLSQFRNFRGNINFGENLVPRETGSLNVGDMVEVIRKR
ncbi:MAG: MOSC N-terminal beta barrel domain-containing protein [Cyanobacteriota bacterium ELA615]